MSESRKTVRVFISSTFRDMHAERNHLVKVVFPALRERLAPYGIDLYDIDLRWGVDPRQSDMGLALGPCLRLIDDCRPFFVGILGQRYGELPSNIPAALISEKKWLAQHPRASFTELEIRHAVFETNQADNSAYFYFRDPAALETAPPDVRSAIYEETDTASVDALAKLKAEIISAGFPVLTGYPATWNARLFDEVNQIQGKFDDLQDFGAKVLEDLWQGLCRRFHLPDQPVDSREATGQYNPDRAVNDELEFYLRERIGRDEDHQRLLQYLADDTTKPILLVGPCGAGKSAVLSRLALECDREHTNVTIHFVNANVSSFPLDELLRHILAEVLPPAGAPATVSRTTDDLAREVYQRLSQPLTGQRHVLLIDAGDQLALSGRRDGLRWLPPQLGAGCKLILTCRDQSDPAGDRILAQAAELGVRRIDLDPLSEPDRAEITKRFFYLSGKELDDEDLRQLVAIPATGNPLFLRLALEEVRQLGSSSAVQERITRLASHMAGKQDNRESLGSLFDGLLQRLAADFGHQLTHGVLGLLVSYRDWVPEAELHAAIRNLLGKAEISSDALTALKEREKEPTSGRAYLELLQHVPSILRSKGRHGYQRWRDIGYVPSDMFLVLRQMRPWIKHAGTNLRLHNSVLEDVVRRHVASLTEGEFDFDEGPYDLIIIDRNTPPLPFRKQLRWSIVSAILGTERMADLKRDRLLELVWQLREMREWDGLVSLLKNPAVVEWFHGSDEHELAWCWNTIQQETAYRARAVYSDILREPAVNGTALVEKLGRLFERLGDDAAAQRLFAAAVELNRQMERRVNEANKGIELAIQDHHIRARLLTSQNRFAEALQLIDSQVELYRSFRDDSMLGVLAFYLGEKARILVAMGEPAKGFEAFQEQESILTRLGDESNLSIVLSNQGNYLKSAGREGEALEVFTRAGQLATRTAHASALAHALLGQAGAHEERQEFALALRQYSDAEAAARTAGDPKLVAAAVLGQGKCLFGQKETAAATSALDESERLCRLCGDTGMLLQCLLHRGIVFLEQKKWDLVLKDVALADELEGQLPADTSVGVRERLRMSALQGQGEAFLQNGALDAALDAFRGSAAVAEKVGDAERHACSCINQGYVLRLQKKTAEASAIFAREEARCRKLDFKFGLALCLGNWGNLHHELGAIESAVACYAEAEQLERELGNIPTLSKLLLNLASALASLEGRRAEAERKLQELADLYAAQAVPVPPSIDQHVARVREELTRREAYATNQAHLLPFHLKAGTEAFAAGDFETAMSHLRETERICREVGEKRALSHTLGFIAAILKSRGTMNEALFIHEEEARLCRELGDQAGLTDSLIDQAGILSEQGKISLALKLYDEAEVTARGCGDNGRLLIGLFNHAYTLFSQQQDPRRALPKCEEALRLARSKEEQSQAEALRGEIEAALARSGGRLLRAVRGFWTGGRP